MRHWPLFDLCIITPRLVLRIPTLDDLDALAGLAYEGVHDPQTMPFLTPWTDADPAERARSTAQNHWSSWAEWRPDAWRCQFVVLADDRVVATQGMDGKDFAVAREVHTGSWVGRRFHGQGIGTQMRAAVLHLAFAGLGAQSAISGAFTDNPASIAVSRKLGYRPDGESRFARRGEAATEQRFRMSRKDWDVHRSVPVTIEGLSPCLPLFGIEVTAQGA